MVGSSYRDPRAWVPITTAGDRAGMLRTGQGAPSADSLLVTQRLVGVAVGAQINYSGVLLGTGLKAR